MPMYTFNLCDACGIAAAFEAIELDDDGQAFAKAGDLLEEHRTCDHVEVWREDHGVVARYRQQPVIRPVDEPA